MHTSRRDEAATGRSHWQTESDDVLERHSQSMTGSYHVDTHNLWHHDGVL